MADCSKTVDFIKEKVRMCNSYYTCDDGDGCSFASKRNGHREMCEVFIERHTDEAITVLQKWSDEHPEPKPKTYADVFFEKFPSAKLMPEFGCPSACRNDIFTHQSKCGGMRCKDCWNEPCPEQEEDT